MICVRIIIFIMFHRTRAFNTFLSRTPGIVTRSAASGIRASNSNSFFDCEIKSNFLKLARDRGFLYQCTDVKQLDGLLDSPHPISAYIGFDATAKSLHVGSLLQIMLLRHLQNSGHKPIILMGGGTTKIGDPSGKDESRKLITSAAINENISSLSKVFAKFLKFGEGPTDAIMINNDEWLSNLNYLEFLRKFGSHFTINHMMSYESVKSRLEREQPLTFLEFNYMILQAYDFVELNKRFGTILQIGGSDQWGNIVCGIELSRKLNKKSLIGLTAPLLQTSSGSKMGKTASGAVWLNSDMLSPLDYWQFWRNTADADVVKFLLLFTEVPISTVMDMQKTLSGAEWNDAKILLADEATRLLHGEEACAAAKRAVNTVFGRSSPVTVPSSATESEQQNVDCLGLETKSISRNSLEGLPQFDVLTDQCAQQTPNEYEISLVQILVLSRLADSMNAARRLIRAGGISVNDRRVTSEYATVKSNWNEDMFSLSSSQSCPNDDSVFKLSVGKKKHIVVRIPFVFTFMYQ